MGHVSGLNHIAIFVSDLERSKHFYHDLLGLPVVEYGERTAGIPELSGLSGGRTREYRLSVPAILGYGAPQTAFALTIDLIQWTFPAGRELDFDINDSPSAHFAFTVLDLQETYEDLKGKEVEFVSPPVLVLPEKGGRLVVWLKDPDGFLLEMVEAKPDWVGAAPAILDTK
jgi:catechol 2,3-dioxygenase-like lactoylglutathione lyase family enzyme